MNEQMTLSKSVTSIKFKVLATSIAVAATVALPQLLHLLGGSIGVGSALGEALLPMHFPILLLGLFVGPHAAIAAGVVSPLLSFMLTGMPKAAMLPFMIIELGVYGLCAGLLKNYRLPSVAKVAIAQLGGRAVRACAILISYHWVGNQAISPTIILSSIKAGWIGIALQILLIPVILRALDQFGERHE